MEDTNLKTEEVVTEEKEVAPTVEQTVEEKEPEEKVEESKTETEKVVEPEEEVVMGIVHNCDSLNVREKPNPDSDPITAIGKNVEVMILKKESTDEYYKICAASGIEGYCKKEYIKIEE